MNLSLHIAKRYLFAKKSHNAINVISMISVCGIAIATMAMVCTLSVFNGFTDVVKMSFSAIDPDLEITVNRGKVFDPNTAEMNKVRTLEGVDFVVESIEENALIKYDDRQNAVLIKGVSDNFRNLASVDQCLLEGQFLLKDGDVQYAVLGVGVAMTTGARANFISPIEIYAPKRDVKVNLANPSSAFARSYAYPVGIFATNQEKYDNQVVFVSLELARQLFRYETEVSALDIKVKDGVSVSKVRDEIKSIIGAEYAVKDRFEQQEESFRMVNIEKWVTFLILAFILVIAVFNVVGSLTMLILDKEADIQILRNMGASNKLIIRIFMLEGWLICLLGAVSGLVLGVGLCLLQQHFGLLKLGEVAGAFIIDAYPVSVQILDLVLIFLTVSLIGFLSVVYPVFNLSKRLKKS